MARAIIDEKNLEAARKQLASIGIILYNKKHRKGGYVCRANKALRESMDRMYALRELPEQDILICGKL